MGPSCRRGSAIWLDEGVYGVRGQPITVRRDRGRRWWICASRGARRGPWSTLADALREIGADRR